jgi:hypothetical protein
VFPPATKCFVEGDQLNACDPLGDDVLGFEFKLLSLGIQHVQKIRQPSLIALRCKLDCVNGGSAGAGKVVQTTSFGVVTRNRLVYLPRYKANVLGAVHFAALNTLESAMRTVPPLVRIGSCAMSRCLKVCGTGLAPMSLSGPSGPSTSDLKM